MRHYVNVKTGADLSLDNIAMRHKYNFSKLWHYLISNIMCDISHVTSHTCSQHISCDMWLHHCNWRISWFWWHIIYSYLAITWLQELTCRWYISWSWCHITYLSLMHHWLWALTCPGRSSNYDMTSLNFPWCISGLHVTYLSLTYL